MDENKPQVFLRNEVVTREDLLAIRNGYAYLHEIAFEDGDAEAAHQYVIAAGVMQQVIDYLDRGKTDFQGVKRG